MFDAVIECMVKRKLPLSAFTGRCGIIFLDIVLFIIGAFMFISLSALVPIALIVWLLGGAATYFVFRNTNLEYEYSFFEGEMVVDKIMGRKVRKRVGKFEFGSLEFMALENSPRMGGQQSNRKRFNVSANDPEMVNYVAVLTDNNSTPCELVFTPNEELLAALNKNYSRKIYQD